MGIDNPRATNGLDAKQVYSQLLLFFAAALDANCGSEIIIPSEIQDFLRQIATVQVKPENKGVIVFKDDLTIESDTLHFKSVLLPQVQDGSFELEVSYSDQSDFLQEKYCVRISKDFRVLQISKLNIYYSPENQEGVERVLRSTEINTSGVKNIVTRKTIKGMVEAALVDPEVINTNNLILEPDGVIGIVEVGGYFHGCILLPQHQISAALKKCRKAKLQVGIKELSDGQYLIVFPYQRNQVRENNTVIESTIQLIANEVRAKNEEILSAIRNFDPRLFFCKREYFVNFVKKHYAYTDDKLISWMWGYIEHHRSALASELVREKKFPVYENGVFEIRATPFDSNTGGNRVYMIDPDDVSSHPIGIELHPVSANNEISIRILCQWASSNNIAIGIVTENGLPSGVFFLDENFLLQKQGEVGNLSKEAVGRISREQKQRTDFLNGWGRIEGNIRNYFKGRDLKYFSYLYDQMEERVLSFLQEGDNKQVFTNNLSRYENLSDAEIPELAMRLLPEKLFVELFLRVISDHFEPEIIDAVSQLIKESNSTLTHTVQNKKYHDFFNPDGTIDLAVINIDDDSLLRFFSSGNIFEIPYTLSTNRIGDEMLTPVYLLQMLRAIYAGELTERQEAEEAQMEIQAGMEEEPGLEVDLTGASIDIIGPKTPFGPPLSQLPPDGGDGGRIFEGSLSSAFIKTKVVFPDKRNIPLN